VVSSGSDEKENTGRDSETKAEADFADQDFHRYDEQVNVFLDCCDPDMLPLRRKYIRYVALSRTLMHDVVVVLHISYHH